MRNAHRFISAIAALVILLACSPNISAGADGAQSPTGWEPKQYDLEVHMYYDHEQLEGKSHITLLNVSDRELDTVNLLLYRLMKVTSVEGQDGPLEFGQQVETYDDYPRLQKNCITVSLKKPVAPGEKCILSIDYEGYLLGMDEAYGYVKETIDPAFTMIRSDSDAYPMIGLPSRKETRCTPQFRFTYDAKITVPDSLSVANGGRLAGKTSEEGETTWHYVSKVPSWRMDFAIAKYKSFEHGRNTVFCLAEDANRGPRIIKEMDRTIDLYTKWFGPLQNDHGLAIIEIPMGYGSQTDVTTIIQQAEAFKDDKHLYELYHEISHKWNVPTTDKLPPRIEEGLACFLQALTVEELEDRAFLDKYMEWDLGYIRKAYDGHPERAGVPIAHLGDEGVEGLSYTVGAVFFRLLYGIVGQEKFNSIIGDFYADKYTTGADVDDFVAYMRKDTGPRVKKLIDEWIYGGKYSDYIQKNMSIGEMAALYE